MRKTSHVDTLHRPRNNPDAGAARILREWSFDEEPVLRRPAGHDVDAQQLDRGPRDAWKTMKDLGKKGVIVSLAAATAAGATWGISESMKGQESQGVSFSGEHAVAALEPDAQTIPDDHRAIAEELYAAGRVLSLASVEVQEAAATMGVTPTEFITIQVRNASDEAVDGSYPKGRAEATMDIAIAGMIDAAYEETTGSHNYGEISEIGIAEQDVVAYMRSLEDMKKSADTEAGAAGIDPVYRDHYDFVYGQAEQIIEQLVAAGHEIPLPRT